MNVFNHDLEAVKAASLWNLNFAHESLDQVLVDNSVRSSEECKDMGDEESLVGIELIVPIVQIFGEIKLLCGPE